MSSSDTSASQSSVKLGVVNSSKEEGSSENYIYSDKRQTVLSTTSTSSSSISSTNLFDRYFVGARKEFHDEQVGKILDVEMIENTENDKESCPYKYRLSLPLNPPEHLKDEYKWESVLMQTWCLPDSDNMSFVIGLKTETDIPADILEYFSIASKRQRVSKLVDLFYVFLDSLWYPKDKNMTPIYIRDFAYPIHSPSHFGHLPLLKTLANENYRAKVIYKFDTTMEGEISINVDEIVTVLKNLGNGWLTAKKNENDKVGLIPENYVQRIT